MAKLNFIRRCVLHYSHSRLVVENIFFVGDGGVGENYTYYTTDTR
jgi:hypothetical protein